MESPISKNELRAFWKKKCASLSNSERSDLCCIYLANMLSGFHKILSFAPLSREIDITECNKKLASEKRLFLPRISQDVLEIYFVTNLSELQKGPFSLIEPAGHSPTPLSEIDLILVPALAFDRNRYRLGYGKGYYDRLLSKTNAFTLGIGFQEQLIPQLPRENHDIPLDALLLF